MKKGNLKLAGLFLISLLVVSCESDDQSEFTNRYDSLDVVSAQTSLGEGEWRVAEFRDDDDDDDFFETIDFDGYVFVFSENGVVTATFGEEVYTGTWKIELESDDDDDDDDDDFDDDDDDEMEFELEFNNANGALDEISEDWDVLEYSDTRIRIGDDDDDDDDELLVFERI